MKKKKNLFNIEEFKKSLSFEKIDFCLGIDVDDSFLYKKNIIVIANKQLFLFNENKEIIKQLDYDQIVDFKADYYINYGRLFVFTNKGKELFCYFDKGKSNQIGNFIQNYKNIFEGKNVPFHKDKHICPKCNRPIDPIKNYCTHCYSKKSTLKHLLLYIKRYKGALALITLMLILSGLIGFFIPVLTRKILYNEVLEPTGRWYGEILLFSATYLLLTIISAILNVFYGRIMAKTSSRVSYDLKKDVFNSMQRLQYKFFQDKETGNLMHRIVWDVNRLFYVLVDNVPYVIVTLIKVLGLMVYVLLISWKLFLLSLITLPFAAYFFIKVTPKLRNVWHQNHVRESELSSVVSDTLEGFRVVKVFSGQEKEVKKFTKVSDKNRKAYIRQSRFSALVYPSLRLVIIASSLMIWGVGGYFVIKNELDFGDFSIFIAAVEMLFNELEQICNIVFIQSVSAFTSARRLFEIIDATPEIVEKEKPVNLDNIKGEIEFKNVIFGYEPIKVVLDDISFKIKPNSKFGIVGETGSGKTTITNLLARLYDPNSGDIYIDGVNIKDISFKSLHQCIAVISQDTYLFAGSVLDNIRYGKEDATEEEVIRAAKLANCHDFILKLENGYETKIGEGGKNLSGGERQRISIARAILLNSKIIIFDEATSAMDSITEHKIQESINLLGKDKTLILIAHRLSTLKDVDNLIVINNHKIVEEGTMEELVKIKDGIFAKLYKVQQEGLQHIRIGE